MDPVKKRYDDAIAANKDKGHIQQRSSEPNFSNLLGPSGLIPAIMQIIVAWKSLVCLHGCFTSFPDGRNPSAARDQLTGRLELESYGQTKGP